MRKKPIIAVWIAGALAAVFAPAAAADSPTIVQESFPRSIPNFVSCPGFTVAGEFEVTRSVFTFMDNTGTPVRQVVHVHFVGALTNTSTGKSIPDEGNQIVTTDLLTGTTVVDGRVRVDTAPGEGVILSQVGRVVRDARGNVIFLAGRNDFVAGTFTDFCGYMAGL